MKEKTYRVNPNARSRTRPAFSEQERRLVHLQLKNYLLIRRNVLSRGALTDGVRDETRTLTKFLDYLRSLDKA